MNTISTTRNEQKGSAIKQLTNLYREGVKRYHMSGCAETWLIDMGSWESKVKDILGQHFSAATMYRFTSRQSNVWMRVHDENWAEAQERKLCYYTARIQALDYLILDYASIESLGASCVCSAH